MRKLSFILFIFLCLSNSILAQITDDSTILRGVILDETAEPILGAIIELLQNNQTVAGEATDYDGSYSITLKNGTYTVKTRYSSYRTELSIIKLTGREYKVCVQLQIDATNCGDLTLHPHYKVPLIDYTAPNKKVYTSDEIEHMAR